MCMECCVVRYFALVRGSGTTTQQSELAQVFPLVKLILYKMKVGPLVSFNLARIVSGTLKANANN